MNKRPPSISIVIPAYNEEKNLPPIIEECFQLLPKLTDNYEVLAVDDASTDNTYQVLQNLSKKYPLLRIFHHQTNWHKGAGQSSLTLYKNARKDLIFWIPGDGQIKPSELPKFLPFTEDLDIVIGWRIYRRDPFQRSLFSQLYHLSLLFLLGLRGTNDIDSVKLFKRKIFKNIVLESRSGFIEAEILTKAKKNGFLFGDIPIRHYSRKHGKQSGISFSNNVAIMWDLLRLFPKITLWPRHLRLLTGKLKLQKRVTYD